MTKIAKNKSYDEDFKKMIVELYESYTITADNIVREYGIESATLYRWVGQYWKIQTGDGEVTDNIDMLGVPDGIYLEVELEDREIRIQEKHIEI